MEGAWVNVLLRAQFPAVPKTIPALYISLLNSYFLLLELLTRAASQCIVDHLSQELRQIQSGVRCVTAKVFYISLRSSNIHGDVSVWLGIQLTPHQVPRHSSFSFTTGNITSYDMFFL
jgi:hypothetical protein